MCDYLPGELALAVKMLGVSEDVVDVGLERSFSIAAIVAGIQIWPIICTKFFSTM